jgi:hypothetical protein
LQVRVLPPLYRLVERKPAPEACSVGGYAFHLIAP